MAYTKTYFDCPLNVDGVYTVHYFEYAKDFAYSGEIHDFWELVYADKKNLFITAGSNEIELEMGQLYIHKPNEFHNIRCDGKKAANSVVISFDCDCPELMLVAGRAIKTTPLEKVFIGNIIKEAKEAFSTPLGNPYTVTMEKAKATSFACEQLLKMNLEVLLISLIRSSEQRVAETVSQTNAHLSEIVEWLGSNVCNRIVFDDIVKEFNLSPSVIKKLFNRHMNCGVMEFFTRLKIDAAKEMIRENNMNFTEISQKLSFSSSQYFTTVFRRVSGMTPKEYANSVMSSGRYDALGKTV